MLEPSRRNAILASVVLPRPVFVPDLLVPAGSAEVLQEWQDFERSSEDSPVRFITPKVRHKERGPLVLPVGDLREVAAEFNPSAWTDVLERYRGTALYELAALLHRVGDDVEEWGVGDDVVVLHLTSGHGLVVAVGEDLLGTAGAAVKEAAEVMLSSGAFSLVTVLAIRASTVVALADLVEEAAREDGWSASTPLTVSTTARYADDLGSSAEVIEAH
jgi:hypothetical protein